MKLQDYVDQERGRQTQLAEALGIPPQLVWQWARSVRPVPTNRCASIELATDGAVTCEELQPGLRWLRVPDKKWPWHKGGRPVLNVAKAVA